MNLESIISFSSLKDTLNKGDLIVDEVKKIIKDVLNNKTIPNSINLRIHPLGFYQVELLRNSKGTARLHYYHNGTKDIQVHRHGGDLASIILQGMVKQSPYTVQNISDNNQDFALLELFISQGEANNFNYEILRKNLPTHILVSQPIKVDNPYYQIALQNYTKKQIKQYGVQYQIHGKNNISYPIQQVLLSNQEPSIIHQGNSYFMGKKEAHKATIGQGTISIVLLEKNIWGSDGKPYYGGPYRQLLQKEPDKIELEKVILDKTKSLDILEEIYSQL